MAVQTRDYRIHPVLLDSCFQAALATLRRRDMYLPVALDSARYYRSPRAGESLWCHVRHTSTGAAVALLDESGEVLLETSGLRFQRLDRQMAPAPVADLLYEVAWTAKVLPAGTTSAPARWLILSEPQGAGEDLAARLKARGDSVFSCSVDPADPSAFDRLFVNVYGGSDGPSGIVCLWNPPNHPETGCSNLAHLVQALMRAGWRTPPRLWLVTRGAQRAGSEPVAMGSAALWGMARVLDSEHPELHCRRVDLSTARHPDEMQQLAAELLAADPGEDEIALRSGVRYVSRLTRSAIGPPPATLSLSAEGTYLITGGFGALGLTFAQWMVERGARNLVLVGRSGPAEAAQETLAEMRKTGARILAANADVAREDELARVLKTARETMPELRGIVHAAGILEDGLVQGLTPGQFARVMAPKVSGAWNLHQMTLASPLEFFVLFSSVAGLLGTAGQANYAAANAYLDALAEYRRQEGRPALSIQWGPWADIGLAASRLDRGERLAERGLGNITAGQGREAFEWLLQSQAVLVAVMRLDGSKWRKAQPAGATLSLLAGFAATSSSSQVSDVRAAVLAAETGRQRQLILERHVRDRIAEVVRISPSRIERQTPLGTLGLDSLMALECRNRLEASLGVTLAATVIWNYPTLATLVPFLAGQMGVELEANGEAPQRARAAAAGASASIAGLSEQEAEELLIEQLGAMGANVG